MSVDNKYSKATASSSEWFVVDATTQIKIRKNEKRLQNSDMGSNRVMDAGEIIEDGYRLHTGHMMTNDPGYSMHSTSISRHTHHGNETRIEPRRTDNRVAIQSAYKSWWRHIFDPRRRVQWRHAAEKFRAAAAEGDVKMAMRCRWMTFACILCSLLRARTEFWARCRDCFQRVLSTVTTQNWALLSTCIMFMKVARFAADNTVYDFAVVRSSRCLSWPSVISPVVGIAAANGGHNIAPIHLGLVILMKWPRWPRHAITSCQYGARSTW